MAHDVVMPMLGMAQETGTLVRWLVAEGAWVEKGAPLMEVETDKVTVEIEAPAAGFLAGVSAAEGDVVPVGQRVAQLRATADASEPAPESAQALETVTAPAGERTPRVTPVARAVAAAHDIATESLPAPADGRTVRKQDVLALVDLHAADALAGNGKQAPHPLLASPLARRLAAEAELSLEGIAGSGPHGAVLAADVRSAQAVTQAVTQAATPAVAQVATPGVAQVATQVAPTATSRSWQIMAERLAQGWSTTPHFYLVREVVADRLQTWLQTARAQNGAALTYTDLMVRAVAAALLEHPQLAASWQEGARRPAEGIHIGIAVATEESLLVPVIHHADRLGLGALAARRAELVERGRSGRLRPDELQGGVFTISNLGMHGVDAFNAIVNPGQAAILAVGRIADRVVAVDGAPAVRPVLILTLSCDHRVTDGARAAAFLNRLAQHLEEPLTLLS
jgi:pyruvate dehydrogenase E2 component (dihydrolipoamide acetyltransferase)